MPLSPGDLIATISATRTRESSHAVDRRPQIFDLTKPDHVDALTELNERGQVFSIRDELETQLVGLMECRSPDADDRTWRESARKHLQNCPMTSYGRWVFYPWSGMLLHLLPCEEYRELRTSRNRNKITREEQERLYALRIGIVGLSIGHAAATTLALEGIGGFFALADFDHLELSNLNRLHAGAHELGDRKAHIAARAMFEIDPYLEIELWTDGVNPGNIDAFLQAGGRSHDLVYEECDDLEMKVLVRERARALRIPVLMETSDRGLIDVERFDLEPERPLFHGLAGTLDSARLRGLSNYEKVPTVMKIIGLEGMSARMGASMVDIETTLASWPQLASEVALGAGINVDMARRIALDEHQVSGRYYVDLERLVPNEVPELEAPPEFEVSVSEEATRLDLPPLFKVNNVNEAVIRTLVRYAVTAFSGGNCQPWLFVYRGKGAMVILHDRARSGGFLDAEHRAGFLALGAIVENIVLTAAKIGLGCDYTLFPDPNDPDRIADVRLRVDHDVLVDPLVEQIGRRVTNRRFGERKPLVDAHRDAMTEEARARGGELAWVEGAQALERLTEVMALGDRFRMISKSYHSEMMEELRWTKEEVERTRDGLDVATLELTPTDLAGMQLVKSWSVMESLAQTMSGMGLRRLTRKWMHASAGAGLLHVDGHSPRSYVDAGRALQRLWLRATADGVALQPMTPMLYMFYRLEHMNGEGLTETERTQVRELRDAFDRVFPLPSGRGLPMLFRVGYAGPPTARSLRRRIGDVLRYQT